MSRKVKQDEAAPRLFHLKQKRDETLYTNLELHKACAMLRQEVKRLRVECAEKGLEKEAEGGQQGQGEEDEDEED